MKRTLILTEKPSVARDFAHCLKADKKKDYFISDHFIITWAIGHLLTPYDPEDYNQNLKKWKLEDLPIVPSIFQYKPNLKTKAQLHAIVRILTSENIDKMIVATDAGREGELIARRIISYIKLKNKNQINIEYYRLWSSEALSFEVIHKSLQNIKPLEEYDRLYAAGMARQMADWLVGMNFSRLVTLKMGDLFSVGRVQTAVLSFLYKRDKEIKSFVEKEYYHLQGSFDFHGILVEALYINRDKTEDRYTISSKTEALKLKDNLYQKEARVDKFNKVNRIIKPPLLYSLTDLQKDANRIYGYTAKDTLDLSQKLYEKYKCLSYPRTDAKVLGKSSLLLTQNLYNNFSKIYSKFFLNFDEKKLSLSNKDIFNDSALTDHHGLIPLKSFNGNKDSKEAKVYFLVMKRFASVFSRDYRYYDTSLYLKVENSDFFARGRKVKDLGWKINYHTEKDKILPELSINEVGITETLKVIDKKTTAPSQYTDSSILQDMVNPSRMVENVKLKKIYRGDIGIGTQSTRAAIIETLITRKYLIREKKNLVITHKGILLIENFNKMKISSKLIMPEETAQWESSLEDIALGRGDGRKFINDIIKFTRSGVEEWNDFNIEKVLIQRNDKTKGSSLGTCPLCKSSIVENKKAYGCQNWKLGCKFTVWKKISGKSISKVQIKKILRTGKSDNLKGFRSKSGKKFNALLVLEEGKIKFSFSRS